MSNNNSNTELEPCDVCSDPDTVTCFCTCHGVMHCFECIARADSRAAPQGDTELDEIRECDKCELCEDHHA